MSQAPPYSQPPNQPAAMQQAGQANVGRSYAGLNPNTPIPNSLDNISAGTATTMDFVTQGRDKNAFARANNHTWLVQFLKVFLPIMGVFLIVALFATYMWAQSGAPVLKVEETIITTDKIVMKNPELKGFDKEKRPYALNAAEAIQNPSKPSVVTLKQIDANVPMQEGLYAKIISGDGIYDSEAKTLELGGTVDIVTDDGMKINLQDADIDIDAGTMITQNPISMRSLQADIQAGSFEIEESGAKIIFKKRVKMTIYPDKFETSEKAN